MKRTADIERETGKTVREAIKDALLSTDSVEAAAARLGTTKPSLYRWAAELGIQFEVQINRVVVVHDLWEEVA